MILYHSLDLHQEIYDFWVVDAMLFKVHGDTLILDDCWTIPGHFDCFHAVFRCLHPDTAEVMIGDQSTVKVKCYVSPSGFIGTDFIVSDEMGWVTDWNPKAVWNDGCACLWDRRTVHISILVPQTTTAYSISRVSVYPAYDPFLSDSTFFFLKAIPSISVQRDSWSGIKSFYNKK